MLTPIALFVGLLLATAFIAHWSDNLGKKLGKKRVSVFGLRPRTSATLLTVVSSWGIMIFTLVALLVTVAPLRRALFRYESDRLQAIQNVQVAESRRKIAQQQEQVAHNQAQVAVGEREVAVGDLNRVRQTLASFKLQVQDAQRNVQNARRGEQTARRAAQTAQAQQKQAIVTLATARKNLAASQNQLSHTREDLAQGRADVERAQIDLKVKQAQVKTADAKAKAAQAREKQAENTAEQVSKALLRLGPQVLTLQREKDTLTADNAKLIADNAHLKADYDHLKANNDRFDKNAAEIINQFSGSALNDIKLPVDQTLAERRVDGGQSAEQLGKELRILLNEAKDVTKKIIPGTKLIADTVIPATQDQPAVQLDEVQTVQFCARLLSSANQPFSVRVAPRANYPANSPQVLARFVLIPVRRIYIARQDIAVATIDTSKNESAIFGQLQRLVDAARVNAVRDGSSPPLSPEEVNFFDGDTGQKIFDALHQVQKIAHPVEVHIVAARDLDSAEPLQIRFIVGDQAA